MRWTTCGEPQPAASYTDEDVERVAEALAEYDDLATPERAHRQRARAALDAYLKAPT